MHDARPQYSLASMMVITRLVTLGSVGIRRVARKAVIEIIDFEKYRVAVGVE